MKAGDVFSVKYPFVRGTYSMPEFDGEAVAEVVQETWTPGAELRPQAPYGEWSEAFCNGEGTMELTVVDVFKPGKYPARVFFTRQWIDPNGHRFGKTALRITTVPAFRKRTRGWFGEPYTIEPQGAHHEK